MSQKGSAQSHVRIQHVIEARPRPASTVLLQCAFGFELCDGERLSGRFAGVDDPRGVRRVGFCQGLGQKASGRRGVPLGR